jgi:GTP-binding protein
MGLIDSITIHAAAGRGGDGVVRWLHIRGKEKGGPSGGDGGRGGDVIFKAMRDLAILARYKGRSEFKAEPGEAGGSENMHGANGEPIIIEVPVGSCITKLSTGETVELIEEDQTWTALIGGYGGYGNSHFKSSTNQNPFESREGGSGQRDAFKIELKIIADAGLVGLPNAGKSSLLNAITAAKSRVGEYAFTTLEPHLGVMYGYALADIPGLIEGAHEGKGLGDSFLRHIARTKVIVHCVAADLEDPYASYQTIRTELTSHGDGLAEKPELIFITKHDMITEDRYAEIVAEFASHNLSVYPVSVLDDALLKERRDTIIKFLQDFNS